MCCRLHSFCWWFSLRTGAITAALTSVFLCIMVITGASFGISKGFYVSGHKLEIMVGLLLAIAAVPFVLSTIALFFGIFRKWPCCVAFWLVSSVALLIASLLNSIYLFIKGRYTISIICIAFDLYMFYLWCIMKAFYQKTRWEIIVAERNELASQSQPLTSAGASNA